MLPDVIGRRRTREILLTNRSIDAELAFDWGLADRIVPDGRLVEEAQGVARRMASAHWESVQRIRTLTLPNREELAARLEAERQNFVSQIVTESTRESMLGFWESMHEEG